MRVEPGLKCEFDSITHRSTEVTSHSTVPWDSWVWMQERADAGELDRASDHFNEHAHKLEADNDDARRDWDRYVARLEWLSHLASDRRDPTMDYFEKRVNLYRLGSPLVLFGLWGEFRPELVDQEWQREAKMRVELLALVRQLIERMVARRGGSAERFLSSVRQRWTRARKRSGAGESGTDSPPPVLKSHPGSSD